MQSYLSPHTNLATVILSHVVFITISQELLTRHLYSHHHVLYCSVTFRQQSGSHALNNYNCNQTLCLYNPREGLGLAVVSSIWRTQDAILRHDSNSGASSRDLSVGSYHVILPSDSCTNTLFCLLETTEKEVTGTGRKNSWA